MHHASRAALVVSAVLASLVMIQDKGRAQDGDPVLDRQLVMQQLDRNSKALGQVLAGIEPKEKLVTYALAVSNDAKEVRASFQAKAPGGNARPEVWSNWPDFSRRLDELVAKSEAMAQIAETGNVNAVNELVVEALPCRDCHMVYRSKKTA
jgi:cytochrome c556